MVRLKEIKPPTYVLEVHRLSKSFPGVQALREVSLTVGGGEVVGLVGENGAGKSTLVKILAGIYHPDGGEIRINGIPVYFHHPQEAERWGLSFIHQQLNLVPSFDVVDNVFLGKWLSRPGGNLDKKSMRNLVEELCQEFEFSLNLSTPVRNLSTAERWMVQIIRVFLGKPQILVMDEPTVALQERGVKTLFQTVRKIAAQGVGILYVSHRLGEIFSLCQRVVVLRNGEKVFEGELINLTPENLITKMVGEEKDFSSFSPFPPQTEEILVVESLSDGEKLQDVSFSLSRGEVLSIYGLQGAGRTELLETLFGVRKKTGGTIRLQGNPFFVTSPKEAIERGVAFVPEDRGQKGLILKHSILENVALPHLSQYQGFWGYFRQKKLKTLVQKVLERLCTHYRNLEDSVQTLSGGNQQKTVLAKWLLRDFTIFLLDEPTTGVDVGARRELYRFIWELAHEGRGILLTSSDLEEILEINPHRVMVLREGKVAGILSGKEIERAAILRLCYQGG
ncbi:MAG: sugar ABC transporter ATP-binding protein [Candidatus Caldatribacteriaceae bacterium]